MNFIDEKDVVGLQGCEDTRQIAGLVKHGAAGDFESHAQFVGNDIAQSGLAQSGRTV